MINHDLSNKGIFVFDFDGTLVDTMDAFADLAAELISTNSTLKEYYIEIDGKKNKELSFDEARKEYIRTSGLPFIRQLGVIFGYEPNGPTNPVYIPVAEQFEKRKQEVIKDVKLSKDVLDTLNYLKEKKYTIAISSGNFAKNIKEFFEHESFQPDLILGCEDGIKGDAHFARIKKESQCDDNSKIVFVADSLVDLQRSYAYSPQVKFIAKLGTFTEEQFKKAAKTFSSLYKTIKEISELKNYV